MAGCSHERWITPIRFPMRSSFTSATESTDGTNRQPINRELFHLRTVNEIRASLAKRDEGADRNAWLYSYNPLKIELV